MLNGDMELFLGHSFEMSSTLHVCASSQEELGAKRVVPLKAGGTSIDVTNENLGECK